MLFHELSEQIVIIEYHSSFCRQRRQGGGHHVRPGGGKDGRKESLGRSLPRSRRSSPVQERCCRHHTVPGTYLCLSYDIIMDASIRESIILSYVGLIIVMP